MLKMYLIPATVSNVSKKSWIPLRTDSTVSFVLTCYSVNLGQFEVHLSQLTFPPFPKLFMYPLHRLSKKIYNGHRNTSCLYTYGPQTFGRLSVAKHDVYL